MLAAVGFVRLFNVDDLDKCFEDVDDLREETVGFKYVFTDAVVDDLGKGLDKFDIEGDVFKGFRSRGFNTGLVCLISLGGWGAELRIFDKFV